MKSIPDEKSTTHMSESFHSQQEMEEHTEFIHNSQKISIYACVLLIGISYCYIYFFKKQ